MEQKTKAEFKEVILEICRNFDSESAAARYYLHDWDEMWRIGYRDAREAFDEALRCE